MAIYVEADNKYGNIWVVDLSKVYPGRGYNHQQYHAVCQQQVQEIGETGNYEHIGFDGPILNSWGENEKIISFSDAFNGVHSRYAVWIKTLIYKGYETGDIPMKWKNDQGAGGHIYHQSNREESATKEYGLDRDYTPEEMKKFFFDLCTDFGLTIEGDYMPKQKKSWNPFSKKKVVQCDDF